ncbi:NlpC/P60 family protein [Allokutzneria sp. A3M-2-11 16]|uniref:bifunctional WXG100 family type VII secretion target/C40 family peptidase n=1 Tax=Allokutzneria sp. A3M-2-11 16 TaxID=2962043 RepID=UPI0020B6B311|nr:C40 family peptidase [Allokutzneria sp. A3M-2-11 16]MCP3800400.1 NlpC/P60 family protein [Allokutzneria sp. A3M-2-11 16]
MADAAGLIEPLIRPLREHLAKLDGDTGSASRAAESLGKAKTTITELKSRHGAQVRSALGGWYGDKANAFQGRVATLDGGLDRLSGNCGSAQGTVTGAVGAVTTGRKAIQGLIDEFVRWAKPAFEAALTAQKAGDTNAVREATARAFGRSASYAEKSAAELKKVSDHLTEAAARLRALQPADPGALKGLGSPLGGNGVVEVQGGGISPVAPPAPPEGQGRGDGGGGSGGSGGGGGGGGGGGYGGGRPNLPVAIPPQPGSGVDINLPGGHTVQAPNPVAAAAVRNALSVLGTPYVWAASDPPRATDCSGLTKWAYGNAGLDLPRHSAAQAIGASVPPGQLLPGDLVVWRGHVAMFIGNGQMVEAGDPVQIRPLRTTNSGMPFVGFYRPTG